MSDPTAEALAAYGRTAPQPTDPSGGYYVDLSGVPERDRPALILAIEKVVGLSRPVGTTAELVAGVSAPNPRSLPEAVVPPPGHEPQPAAPPP
jgi:hypothetical protein